MLTLRVACVLSSLLFVLPNAATAQNYFNPTRPPQHMQWWNNAPPPNRYVPQPQPYNPYVQPNLGYNPFFGPQPQPQIYANPGYNPYGTTTVPLNPNLYNNTYQIQPPRPQPQPYNPPYQPQWYGSPVTGFGAPTTTSPFRNQ